MISAETARQIEKNAGVALRRAGTNDLDQLKALGLPDDVADFYRAYEPSECAEIAGARLWPIAEVVSENHDYVPGAQVFHHGLVVFGTTISGDAYCIDVRLQPAPVFLVSHDTSYEDMESDAVRACAKPIAASFEEFLTAFANGTVDLEPAE
jgi:hypothetical protein